MLRICAAFVLGLLCFAPAVAAEPNRLNIVLLCTDDQRWDTLGCTGNKIVQTPHIDALAREGLVFDNCFVTTSICSISRASLFTGQYARRHGIADFAKPLTDEQLANSYPGKLKAAGYRMGFVGKWGVGNKSPRDLYDYWGGFGGQGRYFEPGDDEHINRKMARQAVEFLSGCSSEQSFCLQVSFKAVHAQDGEKWEYPTEQSLRDLYKDVHIPPPPTATEQHHAALPPMLRDSEGHRRWKPRFSTPELYQSTVKDYYRLITGVDRVVGEVIQTLRDKELFDNTLIIFTGDNGYYLGDFGLADKWFMHEPSIRLPLVIYDPRLPADKRNRHITDWALNIDIAPTILGAAQITPPATMQGLDLLAASNAQKLAERREFYYEHPFKHPGIPFTEGVRGERFKYARYEQKDVVVEQLFDLVADPLEEHDLAAQPEQRETLNKLRARLADWRKEVE